MEKGITVVGLDAHNVAINVYVLLVGGAGPVMWDRGTPDGWEGSVQGAW